MLGKKLFKDNIKRFCQRNCTSKRCCILTALMALLIICLSSVVIMMAGRGCNITGKQAETYLEQPKLRQLSRTITETSEDWHFPEWKYRRLVTVDNSRVAGNVVNFPVAFKIEEAELAEHVACSQGEDILFYDYANSQQIDHEIEYYDNNTGSLVAWLRMPSLSPSTVYSFYMYYGEEGSNCQGQANPTAVWDDDYIMVHHMNDNPAYGTLLDSTGNDHYANFSAPPPVRTDAGKVGYAITFNDGDFAKRDGDDNIDFSEVPAPPSPTPQPQSFTIQAWVNVPVDLSERGTIWTGYEIHNDAPRERVIAALIEAQQGVDKHRFTVNNNIVGEHLTLSDNPYSHNWEFVTYTWRDTFDDLNTDAWAHLYQPSEEPEPYTGKYGNFYKSIAQGIIGWVIGSDPNDDLFIRGTLDEIHISRGVRSNEWIATQYKNQNDPEGFFFLGDEELPKKLLRVYKAGDGDGIASSNPMGIHCGSVCEYEFEQGSNVILTAYPSRGSDVQRWDGYSCYGAHPKTCIVTMTDDIDITVWFTKSRSGNVN